MVLLCCAVLRRHIPLSIPNILASAVENSTLGALGSQCGMY
jgi:hypothetical protein